MAWLALSLVSCGGAANGNDQHAHEPPLRPSDYYLPSDGAEGSVSAGGKDYYVSTRGDDSGDGSRESRGSSTAADSGSASTLQPDADVPS